MTKQVHVRHLTSWKEPISGWTWHNGGWRRVLSIWRRVGGEAWVESQLGLSRVEVTGGGSFTKFDYGTYTTPELSAEPVGGNGHTYSWAWVSGGEDMTINHPTSDGTSISATSGVDASFSGHIVCTVTDSGGRSRQSDPVFVYIGIGNPV